MESFAQPTGMSREDAQELRFLMMQQHIDALGAQVGRLERQVKQINREREAALASPQ